MRSWSHRARSMPTSPTVDCSESGPAKSAARSVPNRPDAATHRPRRHCSYRCLAEVVLPHEAVQRSSTLRGRDDVRSALGFPDVGLRRPGAHGRSSGRAARHVGAWALGAVRQPATDRGRAGRCSRSSGVGVQVAARLLSTWTCTSRTSRSGIRWCGKPKISVRAWWNWSGRTTQGHVSAGPRRAFLSQWTATPPRLPANSPTHRRPGAHTAGVRRPGEVSGRRSPGRRAGVMLSSSVSSSRARAMRGLSGRSRVTVIWSPV